MTIFQGDNVAAFAGRFCSRHNRFALCKNHKVLITSLTTIACGQHYMFNMKSRHLLNLSDQNALDCLSENFNLKNFPGGACSRNSLEKCATRSSDGRYRVHIATVYYISRSPLSQNPPVAPYLSPGLFIFFSASHSVNCIGLKRYRFSPLFW